MDQPHQEPDLDKRLETKAIPRFDIPPEIVREDYLGCRTEVRRANTDKAAVCLHRLIALFGPTVLKALSWSDDHAPREDGQPQQLAEIFNVDWTLDGIKTFLLQHAMPLLKDKLEAMSTYDALFYVDNLIVGALSVNNVAIKTRADLDATGISVTALLPLLWDALEVNYFPTSAAPSIDSGSGAQGPKNGTTANPPRPRKTTSSSKGATSRGGRSARTPKN